MVFVPGGCCGFGIDREGAISRGLGILVGEVINQFFDANGIFGGTLAVIDEAAKVTVGGGIDIDREGR